eukprot:329392_1
MADSSDEYEDDDFDEEYHSENDEDYGSLDSIDDSDLEYTESESTTDSYVYPWPTSEDDSWADISSDEVIQKILLKLPQYDPPDPNADNSDDDENAYANRGDLMEYLSDHSDSFVERDEAILNDLKERANKYQVSKGITETDYQQFMEDVDMDDLDDMDEEFLLDRYPMAMASQLKINKFIPDLYLAKVELYKMYLEYEGDDDEESSASAEASADETSKDEDTIDERIDQMNKKDTQEAVKKDKKPAPTAQGSSQADQPPPEDDDRKQEPPPTATATKEEEVAGQSPKESKKKGKKEKSLKIKKLSAKKQDGKKGGKSPRTPKTPQRKKNVELDGKEREEMIERRRNRRRTQRKQEKEVQALIQQQIDDEDAEKKPKKPRKRTTTDAKKLTSRKFGVGDRVRVISLHGKSVKYAGVIRWVGVLDEHKETDNDGDKKKKEKKTFGIELLDNDGDNDGTYNDKRYFETSKNAPRGVFLNRKEFKKHHVGEIAKADLKETIKRKKKAKQRNDAQMYGNMFDNLWTERIDIVKDNKVARKMGPRDIGTTHGWKGYKYPKRDTSDKRQSGFLSERSRATTKRNVKVERVVKAGPRDIGTAHGWKGYKYPGDKSNKKQKKEKKAKVKTGKGLKCNESQQRKTAKRKGTQRKKEKSDEKQAQTKKQRMKKEVATQTHDTHDEREHLASLRSLVQDKDNIIGNLMLRFALGVLPQDANRLGANMPQDQIRKGDIDELHEELQHKANALAQCTILDNFELRERVNELQIQNASDRVGTHPDQMHNINAAAALRRRNSTGTVQDVSNILLGGHGNDADEKHDTVPKSSSFAQRTMLQNFEFLDQNFHLRNKICSLQDKIHQQV